GGDPKTKVAKRDQLFTAVAPFDAPRPFESTEHRFAGIAFLPDGDRVLITDVDRDRRWSRTVVRSRKNPAAEAKVIFDRSLTDLRTRVKTDIETPTKHFYMVGETYTGDRNLMKYYVDPLTKLDGQFDFAHRAEICSKILLRKGTMQELETFLNGNDSFYGNGIMSTFIGNHDLPRVIHLAQDNAFTPEWENPWYDGKDRNWSNQPGLPGSQSAFERMANAFTLLMTTRGVPLIYYGDEIGLPGAGDPDNRRDMQWSGYSAGQNLLKTHLQKLGQIRKDHVALRRGNRTSLWATTNSMAYKMVHPMETVYVVINRGDGQDSVSGLPNGTLTNQLTGQTVTGPTINIPARTSMILTQ
ncbi:MAG TPA: alpha-amylase family glycosyl hydrolase, partial [Polyangium sp.]|nr:alpha-amylase family glycosyl hydrolase [Polyangium sp.]